SVVFFFRTPPPPAPTLFPYTTLFRSRRYLTRAVALAPGRATFLSNLAYLELSSGKLEEASRLARRATVLDPKLGSAWINLGVARSEEHTSELQSRENLVCRLLLEKKK